MKKYVVFALTIANHSSSVIEDVTEELSEQAVLTKPQAFVQPLSKASSTELLLASYAVLDVI